MSGSKSSSSTLSGSRLGTLVLALALAAPPAVLLAAPASADPEVTATPLEASCGVALALRGFPAGPHDVRLSITPADGAALQVQDDGRLTVSGGAPRSVDVTATPAEGRGPYEVLVTVDDAAQPAAELALPECAAAGSAGASPSASPAGASPSPSSSPAADASPSPAAGSASPATSATPSATPATSPDAAGAPSPTTSPSVAGEESAGEGSSVAAPGDQEQPVVAAAAPEAAAPAPAVLAGPASSGLFPLAALAAPATGAHSSVAAVTVPVVAPLPLTAPPALPVPLAAPPVVALPEGAAGPLLAAAPVPALEALLPELPLGSEADPDLAAAPRTAAPDVPPPGIAEALPGALLLASLVGARARRRRLA